jgi:hypothetical protein
MPSRLALFIEFFIFQMKIKRAKRLSGAPLHYAACHTFHCLSFIHGSPLCLFSPAVRASQQS